MGSLLKQKKYGFTIIELLVVIVVIGILASITFVAFNGITTRTKTTSAATAANGVSKAIEVYNTQIGVYPSSLSALNGAASIGQPYAIPSSITFQTTMLTSAPSSPATITLTKCDAASSGTVGGLGNQIIYWNYSTNSINAITIGSTGSGCTIVQ